MRVPVVDFNIWNTYLTRSPAQHGRAVGLELGRMVVLAWKEVSMLYQKPVYVCLTIRFK